MVRPVERKLVDDSVQRTCKVCGQTKQLNLEFNFHSTSEYYSNCCKDCANLRRKLKRLNLPIPKEFDNLIKPKRNRRVIENKPWRKTTHANRKRLQYKVFDKKRGLDHDLTVEFLEKSLNSPCHYCGDNSCGLDRKDNSIGHTMNNCVPCCYECNTAKNNSFSYEEMLFIGKAIKTIKENRKHG